MSMFSCTSQDLRDLGWLSTTAAEAGGEAGLALPGGLGGGLHPWRFGGVSRVSPKFGPDKVWTSFSYFCWWLPEKKRASPDTTWVSEHGATAWHMATEKTGGHAINSPPLPQEGVRSELLPAVLAATESLLKAGSWGEQRCHWCALHPINTAGGMSRGYV